MNSACPASVCVLLSSAESLLIPPSFGGFCTCPTAGLADTGGRAGEVRDGTSASRYVDGSIIPAWSTVFPEP